MPLNIVVMQGMVIELAVIRCVKSVPRSANVSIAGVCADLSGSKALSARKQSTTMSNMLGLVASIMLLTI
jgi:hypothetical protein